MKIQKIEAIEILDSRGNPTVEVNLQLEDGTYSRAMVPSGASTGEREAAELRDGDKNRYGGKGVLKAVKNVNTIIAKGVANSILIKLNQIGTVTETLETIELAYKNSYHCFVSHRSGETVDSFIADLTVAVNAGHLKTGSGCRGERVEKFNQLMRIEHELGKSSSFAGIKAFKNAK